MSKQEWRERHAERSGARIEAYARAHAGVLGAPLIVNRSLVEAMKREGADTDRLERDGAIYVTRPIPTSF